MPKIPITDENLRRMFVYGTLITDNPEHTFGTINGALYTNGRYPFLVEGNDIITGEVQDFSSLSTEDWKATLDLLDQYEGVEHDLYTRLPVEVNTAEGPVMAWVYIYVDWTSAVKMESISGGDWMYYKHKSNQTQEVN